MICWELFFVVVIIKLMEYCLVFFFDICDVNKDRKISLYEWGGCLGFD